MRGLYHIYVLKNGSSLSGVLFLAILISMPIVFSSLSPASAQVQQEFLTWTDPEGRFSIEYPSDWLAEEKKNRFEYFEVTFTDSLSKYNGYLSVDYSDRVEEEEVGSLELFFNSFVQGFGPAFEGFREVEDRDFSKYTIDGERAGSVIFAADIGGIGLGGLLVVSVINDRVFGLAFLAGQDNSTTGYPR
jgi:hypothetical protein